MKIITLIKKLLILGLLVNFVSLLKLNSENSNSIKIKEAEGESVSESESEGIAGKLNGQIYLKGTAEKHRKSRTNLQTNFASKKKEESKAKNKINSSNKSLSKNTQTPTESASNSKTIKSESPIIAELWVKYFKYTNSELNVKSPKSFFVNSGYYQQTRLYPNVDFTKGKEFIRNKNYFYLSVFKNSLTFTSSKKVKNPEIKYFYLLSFYFLIFLFLN